VPFARNGVYQKKSTNSVPIVKSIYFDYQQKKKIYFVNAAVKKFAGLQIVFHFETGTAIRY
jgi:hypothetical protein